MGAPKQRRRTERAAAEATGPGLGEALTWGKPRRGNHRGSERRGRRQRSLRRARILVRREPRRLRGRWKQPKSPGTGDGPEGGDAGREEETEDRPQHMAAPKRSLPTRQRDEAPERVVCCPPGASSIQEPFGPGGRWGMLLLPRRSHDLPDQVPDQLLVHSGIPRQSGGAAYHHRLTFGVGHLKTVARLEGPDLPHQIPAAGQNADQLLVARQDLVAEPLEIAGSGRSGALLRARAYGCPPGVSIRHAGTRPRARRPAACRAG